MPDDSSRIGLAKPLGPPTVDSVKAYSAELLKALAQELERGRSEGLLRYLAAMSRFHRYSWGNVLLIHSQRPDATRVAGYHTWRDLGRWVKRGEKGLMIYAPVVARAHETVKADELKLDLPDRAIGYRAAYVFDVSQTDGKALPEFAKATGDPKEFGNRLKAIVAERGITLEYDRSIAPAFGMSSGGRIQLMPGMSAAEEFSTLAHELGHELLHHKPEAGALAKQTRETQAEAVAFVVARAVGVESTRAAADYIALYHGDVKALGESLAAIQEASSTILKDLLPEERFQQPRERTSDLAASMEARFDERSTPPPATERSDGLSLER